MDYSLYDIFDSCYDWVITIIQQFRRFILGNTAIDRDIAVFFFLSVPIIFAALEIIFDWLIPTFTNLEPMGIRRFFGIRFDGVKVPELKSYNPVKSDKFRFTLRSRFKLYKSNMKLSPHELRHYQQLYQQRFNCTASPMQLKHFVISEGKHYNYGSGYTGLTADNKVTSSIKDSSLLGKGVSNNIGYYIDYKEEKEKEERRKAF